MDSLLRDVRYAFRALASQPGWTIAAAMCLALATGANSTAFSIVNALLLRPLPFAEPDRLAMVAVFEPGAAQTRPFSLADYDELAPAVHDAAELAIRTYLPVALAAGDDSRMVQSELVSPNYFDMLRVKPLAGRFFDSGAGRRGGAPELVLSHQLWLRRFGGDSSIIGRTVRVNGRPMTVRGITPRGFAGAMRLLAADMWLPAGLYAQLANLSPPAADQTIMFGVVGRLSPGVDRERLRARLDVLLARRPKTEHGVKPATSVVVAASGFGVPPVARGAVRSGSFLLGGLMSLFVGVTIANVVSLVLARVAGRRRELGVRFALGASWWRVSRQMACESAMLSFAGAGGGFLLANWATHLLAARSAPLPEHLSYAVDIRPDIWVVAYALAAAALMAVALSVAPARYAARLNLIDVLKSSGPGSGQPSTARTLTTIVGMQIALSTVLLVGAGLLVRTYLNAEAVDPVFRPLGVATATLDLNQLGDRIDGLRFSEELLARATALPGVDRASLARELPLGLGSVGRQTSISSADPRTDASTLVRVESFVVSPGYFDTLGIPLLAGRDFEPVDRGPAQPVAIVNETLARRLWPDAAPIGRTLRLESGERVEVIAVAKDAKYRSLVEPPRAVFYRPFAQDYSPQMTLFVRASSGAATLIAPMRAAIRGLNPDLAVVDARTLDDRVDDALAQPRNLALYLSVVCALGLVMSGVGLFGVVSYSVRTRSHEIGVRMALGAAVAQVRRMVLTQTLRVAAAGLAIGLCGALALSRFVARLLYGVTPFDPATLLAVAGVVLTVACAAAYLPARWATNVDPLIVLRQD
jgi:predicted permease